MSIPVVGLGAGGHARVVIEMIRLDGRYEVVGLLDSNPLLKGGAVLGVPVWGDDDLIPTLAPKGIHHSFMGLGGAADQRPRRRLFERALAGGLEPVTVVHPRAVLSPSARLGPGTLIMANAVVNAGAIVGANVIINTGAIVEHDCVIEDHAHIATGARLASGVHVGQGTHVGLGASVRQRLRIGANVVVGAGAAVVKDVPDSVTMIGVPGRPLRKGDGQ